tara:strand:- start:13469 stop:14203 length:735 start_codon:yes stop_codon:yes gene_type:complete
MNDMMPLGGAQPLTMSSREIADLCETRHNQVVETIQRLMSSGVLRDSRKTPRRVQPEGGGRPMDVYDLTKRDTLVVISGYRDDIRARIIDRWLELEAEKQAAPQPTVLPDLSDPAVLVPLLTSYAQHTQIAEGQVAVLSPKAEAYDRLDASEGAVNVRVAAKLLNIGERKFVRWMAANGWAFRQNGVGTLQAYVAKRDAGYLEHRPHTFYDQVRGEDRTVAQMMVTPKGLAKLAKLLGKREETA